MTDIFDQIANASDAEFAAAMAVTEQANRQERAESYKMALRDAVLDAMDRTAERFGAKKPSDADLPTLFQTLDAFAEKSAQ